MKLSETISGSAQKVGNFATAHQTAIEVGLSWGLFGTAAIMAWISAPKAKEELEAKKAELKTDILPAKDRVIIIGKYAIKVAVPFAAACVINNDAVSHVEKNLVATTAVAEMWRNHAIDYQEATKRVVGEKKETKIQDDMYAKEVEKNPPVTNVNIYAPKEDGVHRPTLFYDTYTKRYFWERLELVQMSIAEAYKEQECYDEISGYTWLTKLPPATQEQIFKGMVEEDIDQFMNEGWNDSTGNSFHVTITNPIGTVPSGEYAGYPYLELRYDRKPFLNF